MPLPDSEFMYPRPSGWMLHRKTFLYRCEAGHEHRFLTEEDDRICMFTHWGSPCLLALVEVKP